MSFAREIAPPSAPVASGGVAFLAPARRGEVSAELRARRWLVIPPAACSPLPGGLRRAIDDAVEGALALRGALPPGVELDASVEAIVADQVFRARTLGATGLAIVLPALPALPDHALDRDDGAALAAWIAAGDRAPVALLFDERDRDTSVLLPRRLGDLGRAPARPAEAAPEQPTHDSDAPASGEVERAESAEADADPPTQRIPRPPPPVLAMPKRGVLKKRPRPDPLLEAEATPPAPPPPAPAPAPAPEATITHPRGESDLRDLRESDPREDRLVNAAEWRTHALELDKARGPKPVSVIDKLFATRYMPLLGAQARGEIDGAVKGVIDAFRTNFEHSYREAFAALRVTGKRPPMVFDAPDLAARIGRLNGARAVKLLLVDAMRFDLGERVGKRLGEQLAGRAVCVERTLLWSALPTTTPTQMALLGRGAEGLRDAEPSSEPEAEIVRGRAVGTIRRERAGSREVMKLDLVEARLRNAGPGYEERFESIADEVAQIAVRYIETLPPRTLLFLFGDHGFRLPASADGRATGQATQGGVSPEEVLVPGQAWLIGGVH